MEIAGAVIGIASLAGLFTTALEVFDTISSAARFDSSHEILQVKVEVEKVRLLVWGQAVGLGEESGEVNELLEREYVRNALAGLLVCFVKILEGSQSLRERYGLIEIENSSSQIELQERDNLEASMAVLGSTFKKTYDRCRNSLLNRRRGKKLKSQIRFGIGDEGKFRTLVSELKAINDSLNHLIPGVKEKARVRVRTQIMQATNERQLQNLANSADDINDLISETATLRLEMLSGRGSAGAIPVASSAAIPQPPVQEDSIEHTTEDLSQVQPAQTAYNNHGALTIHRVIVATNSPSFYLWLIGYDEVEVLEQPKPLFHPSMEMFHIPRNFLPFSTVLMEGDPEADPRYEGWAPASVSTAGFAREFCFAEVMSCNIPEQTWLRAKGTPAKSGGEIFKRWNEIYKNDGLGPGWTKEKGYQEMRTFLGENEYNWIDPEECFKLRHQIADLLGSLSRDHVFPAFDAGSIGSLAIAGMHNGHGLLEFMYQMLHAKELSLRLEKEPDVWHGGLTTKIVHDMIAAELVMKNMECNADGNQYGMKISPETRERQFDAMIAFAEKMKWPYLAEVRSTVAELRKGNIDLDVRTWDWVAGLVLPGSFFSGSLLFGLYKASGSVSSTSLKHTVSIHKSNYGLVLPQLSYWRTRSVLGRVLGALDGVNDIGGWIGPCPVPRFVRHGSPPCLVEFKTRAPTFLLPETPSNSSQRFDPNKQTSTWGEEPEPPSLSNETCKLQAIRLVGIPSLRLEHAADTQIQHYQAKLDFQLVKAKKMVTLSLHTNPIFIAAPSCQGKHRISSESETLYHHKVIEISQLDRTEPSPAVITVINASAHGGEVMARAWCAQTGMNAVVWNHTSQCCFKCALMTASTEGLGVNVLIVG